MNQARAHKISDNNLAELPADESYAALAEQLTLESWHLPPLGDQSWREMDALRIFGASEKNKLREPAKPDSPALDPVSEWDDTARQSWGGILAILLLVPAITLFVAVLAFPDMLTAAFWRSPAAPLHLAKAPAYSAAAAEPAPARTQMRASLAEPALASHPAQAPDATPGPKGVLIIDATPNATDVTPPAPSAAAETTAANTARAFVPTPTARPDLGTAPSIRMVETAPLAEHPTARRGAKRPAVPRITTKGHATGGFYAMVAGADGTLRYQFFPSHPTSR